MSTVDTEDFIDKCSSQKLTKAAKDYTVTCVSSSVFSGSPLDHPPQHGECCVTIVQRNLWSQDTIQSRSQAILQITEHSVCVNSHWNQVTYTHTPSSPPPPPPPPPAHTHTPTDHVTRIEYPVEGKVLIGLIESSSAFLARVSVWIDRSPLGSLEVSETWPLELVHPGNGTCTIEQGESWLTGTHLTLVGFWSSLW